METAGILLHQLLQMLIYIAIGFILYRTKKITKEGSAALSNLLLYVILPCAIVNSFRLERTAETMSRIGMSLLVSLVVLVIAMGISFLVFRKDAIANFSASFSNAGFMGIPLITAMLGGQAVCYIAGLVAMLNALQWTYGQWIMSGDKKNISPKAVLLSPMVLAFLIGLLVFFTQLPLPTIVSGSLSAIAACNAPVAMIILGVFLGQSRLVEIFTDKRVWLCSAVRLLVIPAVTLLAFLLIPEEYSAIRLAIFLAACAPAGSNVAVYAQKLKLDAGYAGRIVCLSTLLSVISMPVMTALFDLIIH